MHLRALRLRCKVATTVNDILKDARYLLKSADIEEHVLESRILLAHTLGLTLEETFFGDQVLNEDAKELYLQYIDRRVNREPTAYIKGESEFFGHVFKVNQHVLIPRPETEILVETVLEYIRIKYVDQRVSIADIGTGSGCIAIALAKSIKDVSIIGIDTSGDSIKVAQANASAMGVSKKIQFKEGNLLDNIDNSLDIIVSNLPYIPSAELDFLQPEIKLFEPTLALDGGIDGLQIVKRLIRQSGRYLVAGKILFLEIGKGQEDEIIQYSESLYGAIVNIQVVLDYSGISRVLSIQFK